MTRFVRHCSRCCSHAAVKWVATAAGGSVLPLAFAPWSWWWLPPLSLAVLFHYAWHASPGRAFLLGYLFGIGLFGVGVSWVHVSMTRYGGGAPLVSYVATGGLIALLAAFPAAAMLAARLISQKADAVTLWFAMPAAWVILEWVRTWLFTGFPWLLLGYSQTESPFAASLAPIAGVLGLSAAVALLAAALTWCVDSGGWLRWGTTALAVTAIASASRLVQPFDWTQPVGGPLEVVLVQGNFDQAEKWRPENRSRTLSRYAALTQPYWGADLIIWPETALPLPYESLPTAYSGELTARIKVNKTTLILGAPTSQNGQLFNSAIAVGTDTAYHKRHLVPFGEYVPLRGLFGDLLDVLGAPESDFSAGTTSTLLTAAEYRAAIAICYEIIFSSEVARQAADSDFIVNMSNDAWFGDTIGPWQHLQIAQMRAMETGRYVLRATNTGVTAVIDEGGRVIAQAPQFTTVALASSLIPHSGLTPFMQWRDRPVLFMAILLLLGLAARQGLSGSTADKH